MNFSIFEFDPDHPSLLLIEIVQPREDWKGYEAILEYLPIFISRFASAGIEIKGLELFLNWVQSGEAARFVQAHRIENDIGTSFKTAFPQHAGLLEFAQQGHKGHRLDVAVLVVALAYEWRQADTVHDRSDALQYDRYHDRLEQAWRALRRLPDTEILRIPPISPSIEQFSERFEKRNQTLEERFVHKNDIRQLQELQRFFRFYLGDGRHIVRDINNTPVEPEIQRKALWIMPDVDISSEREPLQVDVVYTVRKKGTQADADHTRAGNSPDEMVEGPALLFSSKPLNTAEAGFAKKSVKKSQINKQALRRVNSTLPDRWEILTEFELSALWDSIIIGEWGKTDEGLLTVLILLTGRSAEALLDTRAVKSSRQLPKEMRDPGKIFLLSKEQSWAGGVLKPKAARKRQRNWVSQFERTQDFLIFGIPDRIWQLIEARILHCAGRAELQSATLFQGSKATKARLLDRIDEKLKTLNKSRFTRLTRSRIEYQLFASLHIISTDLIDAALVTGRYPPFGASAAIYYHHARTERLSLIYAQALKAWSAMIPSLSFRPQAWTLDLDAPRVGSRFVLRPEVMRGAIGHINQQIQEYRNALGSPGSLSKFHNLYTAYVVLMLFWATGYRAVRDPIGNVDELNVRRQTVVIADKTDDRMSHSRIVFLPSLMVAQLSAYQQHCELMRKHAWLTGVEDLLSTFFFFVDEGWQAIRAKPKFVASQIDWAFPWPLNVSRHYLRGHLRDNGVPGDVVDAFMGHWGIGTEPWGKLATMDPHVFRDATVPVIGHMLTNLGFRLVKGAYDK